MSKSYVLVSFSEYIHVLGTSVLGELFSDQGEIS